MLHILINLKYQNKVISVIKFVEKASLKAFIWYMVLESSMLPENSTHIYASLGPNELSYIRLSDWLTSDAIA